MEKLWILFAAFFMSVVFMLFPVYGEGGLTWRASTRIVLNEGGTGYWVIEMRASLKTEEDKAAFFNYTSLFTVENFSEYIRSLVEEAAVNTGRSMRVEFAEPSMTVRVLKSPIGLEGIIQFQFYWIGFAEVCEGSKIKVGDTFSGGMDLLMDDMLIIYYPEGFGPVVVEPKPDLVDEAERKLIWFGPENFGAGEPIVILEKETFDILKLMDMKFTVSLIFIVLLGLVCLRLYLINRRYVTQYMQIPPSVEFEDDEQRVIKLLRKAGGTMLQSAITKQCGFSKSKTSEILKRMEEKKLVRRRRKGREKIVELIKGVVFDESK